MRVLHVLRQLSVGGIERWLLDLFRHGVPGVRFEVLVEVEEPGTLESEFRDTGVAIHRWQKGDAAGLARLLRMRRIDGVHSHVHAFSGFVLSVARLAGIPLRLAHSHCVLQRRSLYDALMRRLLQLNAQALAVSQPAGRTLFRSQPFRLLPPARDFAAFAEPVPKSKQPGGPIVLGHVGRVSPIKNQAFLLKLLAYSPDCRLVMATGGDPPPEFRQHPRVRIVSDPAVVWREADVFAFPSHHEGLGLAVVEAQAAGLPCVISPGVPEDVVLSRERVRRVELNESRWWEAAQQLASRTAMPDRSVLVSLFHIPNNARRLGELYGV